MLEWRGHAWVVPLRGRSALHLHVGWGRSEGARRRVVHRHRTRVPASHHRLSRMRRWWWWSRIRIPSGRIHGRGRTLGAQRKAAIRTGLW